MVETFEGLVLLLSFGCFFRVWEEETETDMLNAQMNLGGAKDLPDLNQVWENVQAKLEGKAVVHEKYAKTSVIGLLWGKIFG